MYCKSPSRSPNRKTIPKYRYEGVKVTKEKNTIIKDNIEQQIKHLNKQLKNADNDTKLAIKEELTSLKSQLEKLD